MNDNQDPSLSQQNQVNPQAVQPLVPDEPAHFASFDIESPTVAATSTTDVPTPLGQGSAPVMAAPQPQQAVTKKSRKGLVIGIVLAVLGLGLIGSGAAAYIVYQEPENVLVHTASNMLSMQKVRTKTVVTSDATYGTGDQMLSLEQLTFESGMERLSRADTNAELKVLYGDKHIVLKADVLVTNAGELYFRVSNAKDTIQKTLGESMMMSAEAESIIDKIDGKWAKYTIADLKTDNPRYGKVVQCTLDVYNKYKDDNKVAQELVDLYKANQFMVIDGEPQDKVTEVGYAVKINDKKFAAYSKAAKLTTVARELRECDDSKAPVIDADDESGAGVDAPYVDSNGPKTVTTLWITKYSHKLRAIDTKTTWSKNVEGKPMTVTTRTDILDDQGATTNVPGDAMPAKQWVDRAGEFYGALRGDDSSISASADNL